jgi:hypothetical protein
VFERNLIMNKMFPAKADGKKCENSCLSLKNRTSNAYGSFLQSAFAGVLRTI